MFKTILLLHSFNETVNITRCKSHKDTDFIDEFGILSLLRLANCIAFKIILLLRRFYETVNIF